MKCILNLNEAVSAWNAAYPQRWPRSHGVCPICDGRDCFGALPGSDGARWACFDTAHPADGSRGVAGDGCVTGDALDVEAHARRCSRVEVLVADGFLAPGQAAAPQRPRPARRLTFAERIAGEWAALAEVTPSTGADLLRLDASGRPFIRAYSLAGRPVGVVKLEALAGARGWVGACPRGAALLQGGTDGAVVLVANAGEAVAAARAVASGAVVLVAPAGEVEALRRRLGRGYSLPGDAAALDTLGTAPPAFRAAVQRLADSFGAFVERVEVDGG